MPEILRNYKSSSSKAPESPLEEEAKNESLREAIISTLAFFSLYNLPLSAKRVHKLLLGKSATLEEVEKMLKVLVEKQQIVSENNLFALKKWDSAIYNANQLELAKKWQKIDRYFGVLSVLPFVEQISVINSLALGTSDADSDIDFFVITKNNRLYFVRTMIIVVFRLLGVYKTRQKIKDRFCFGFFITKKSQNLYNLLLKPEDPYLVFWLANMRPILGGKIFENFMQENSWVKTYFPNFARETATVKQLSLGAKIIKSILEILLFIPSSILEPILLRIHINHTFKLAENNTVTSTTIANKNMLKLHGYDVRAEVAEAFERILTKG
jgi:hypothetical protein